MLEAIMIGSVGNSNALGLITAFMNEATTQQNVEDSLVKKSLEVEKAQGEAALQLIDSASTVASSGRIDVHA
ncbi:MAG: hypothetical protein QX194_00125 [Methylococcales bacterium]